MSLMLMPILRPVPIETKGQPFWKQVWILLTCVRKWQVVGNWHFKMPDDTVVIIPDGFELDLASTPKFLWGILDPAGVLMIPGIIHDFGYRFDYLWTIDANGCLVKYMEGAGKAYWDEQFLQIDLKVNGLRLTGHLSWFGLQIGGGSAWYNNRELNQPDILPK